MKKLYFGLMLMLCGALLAAGAMIATGSIIGGHDNDYILNAYQLIDYDSGSRSIAFGYIIFFSGLLIAGIEAFKKEK